MELMLNGDLKSYLRAHRPDENVTQSLAVFAVISPLKPNSSKYYTLPYRPNLSFLISDIQALGRSGLSARVPERQKLKMIG